MGLYFPVSHRKVKKDNPLRSLRLCGELFMQMEAASHVWFQN